MASTGYKVITKHGHPNASAKGKIQEHIFVMSELLGRPLTALEVVHHKDENKGNNHPDNLQLFASQVEHMLHHTQQKALKECGNSSFRRCCYCGLYDDPQKMFKAPSQQDLHHKECKANYQRARRAAIRKKNGN